MKQTQRDIKYIIKRILIGVGIAIILFNLKKCNVYADTPTDYFSLNLTGTGNTKNWSYSNSDISSCSYGSLLSFDYNDTKYNICIMSESSLYPDPQLVVLERNDTLWVSYGIGPISSSATYFSFVPNGTDNVKRSFFDSSNNELSSLNIQSVKPGYQTSGATALVNITRRGDSSNTDPYTMSATDMFANAQDFTLVYTTFNLPIYINNNQVQPPIVDPLESYTKVDLTGYQAVLLVPKNYQTMLSDSSHTTESPPGVFRTYLDLEYYSQECVRGTLINVENVKDIMMNNIGVGTGNLSESITGTCYAEPTQTIMSYEFDQYSGLIPRGLLIYNGSYDWQSGFNEDTSYFGTSYVWYDSIMYNSYLVESFDNFNQTIQYKDYSGQDQEVTIESLPTFTESMENAIDNVDSPTPTEVNRQKLQAIFEFLKSPFSFLNKLNTTSCTPIDLPFPRSNQNIHLECLSSSVYDRYLSTALKSIVIIIINGLLFYRCTLSNIDIFTDILDPEDNKLEAVQL